MGIYLRSEIYWYKFTFQGQNIRETSNSRSRTVALRIQAERRRKLELGLVGLKVTKQPMLFSAAAKEWLESKRAHWSANSYRIESKNLEHTLPHLGKLLLVDIEAEDVSRYHGARKMEGAGPKTINLEIGTLRGILRRHRLWANLQPDIRMLRVRENVGRALTADEEHRLLVACRKSRSRSLYPAVLMSLHTGLRSSELRLLRWRQIDLLEETVIVAKSKTAGGEGRMIPLSATIYECLKEWRSNFPDALPSHYVFPSERYGLAGEKGHKEGQAVPYAVDPETPIGSWKVSWTTARTAAEVECRWHDMRHSFLSRMAQGQATDSTIMALAGHLSRKMMERYSHVGGEAKRKAISGLDTAR